MVTEYESRSSKELFGRNDELIRENVLETLEHLVTGTYVCGVYGFEIEEVGERIKDKTMVGFDLGILGRWLPEWQFVRDSTGSANVTPLAIELREAWGDFDLNYFVKVMATHKLENVPMIGISSTYGELVRIGVNPLQSVCAQETFRTHGIGFM
jgi:hypothetical protein